MSARRLATNATWYVFRCDWLLTSIVISCRSARALSKLREQLNLSRGVFASYLRTKLRTLHNWEQGCAKPNAQAALLIRMVQRFPGTVNELAVCNTPVE